MDVEQTRGAAVDTFERVYTARYPPLFRTACLITGDPAVAEEVVQEAFVELYRCWDNVKQPEAWTYVAVVNGCRKWQRGHIRERDRLGQLGPVDQLDSLAASADSVAVRIALVALTPRQRAAVVLRYFDDLPESQIAEILRCRPGTVKSLLSRSMTTLRGVLDDQTRHG